MTAPTGDGPRRWKAALVAAFLALALGLPAAAEPQCDASTLLTLVGMDTAASRLLFAVSGDGEGRLLELTPDGEAATAWPAAAGRHFAGSVGPGPLFALRRCGDGCRRAERWEGGAWQPLGEALSVDEAANLYATWDGGGRPWIVAHYPVASAERWLTAEAFTLEGERWLSRGRLRVTAVPPLGVLPAPWADDAVISGTGLFSAGGEPTTWLGGLPAVPLTKEGPAWPLSETAAAYVAADGQVYVSDDAGASWRASRWRPWGVSRHEVWTYGRDYSLDLPLGAFGRVLPVSWFDRRPRHEPLIFLAELAPDGDWTLRSEVPPTVLADTGERLELAHFLRTAAGDWLMLSDCFTVDGTAGLALRVHSLAGLAPARFLPVVTGR
jgi:hypothetical protein